MAVLTKGELATEKAIFLAEVVDLAFSTHISMTFFAPSPSTTICLAKSNIIFEIHFLKLSRNLSE